MRYRALGDSGLRVSVAGLGCNNFGRRLGLDATRAVVDAALDAGITLLDTADSYGGAVRSEELLGEVLEGRAWSALARPQAEIRQDQRQERAHQEERGQGVERGRRG